MVPLGGFTLFFSPAFQHEQFIICWNGGPFLLGVNCAFTIDTFKQLRPLLDRSQPVQVWSLSARREPFKRSILLIEVDLFLMRRQNRPGG